MDPTEVKMDPCGHNGCDKMSVPGTDRCFVHDPQHPGMQNPKVKFGKSLIIHGDDWQVRIFSSGSQPKYPERSYFVLFEDAYGDQTLSVVTEAELDERLVNNGSSPPNSVEEMLRMANLDRVMNDYTFPAPTPLEMKDI